MDFDRLQRLEAHLTKHNATRKSFGSSHRRDCSTSVDVWTARSWLIWCSTHKMERTRGPKSKCRPGDDRRIEIFGEGAHGSKRSWVMWRKIFNLFTLLAKYDSSASSYLQILEERSKDKVECNLISSGYQKRLLSCMKLLIQEDIAKCVAFQKAFFLIFDGTTDSSKRKLAVL